MNQKQLNRILQLHKEGVPPHTCVLVILQQELGHINSDEKFREAAITVEKFYSKMYREADEIIKELNNINVAIPARARAISALIELGWSEESAEELVYLRHHNEHILT